MRLTFPLEVPDSTSTRKGDLETKKLCVLVKTSMVGVCLYYGGCITRQTSHVCDGAGETA